MTRSTTPGRAFVADEHPADRASDVRGGAVSEPSTNVCTPPSPGAPKSTKPKPQNTLPSTIDGPDATWFGAS
jgi:hypothetical protein